MPRRQRDQPRRAGRIDAQHRWDELYVHEGLALFGAGVFESRDPRERVEEHPQRASEPIAGKAPLAPQFEPAARLVWRNRVTGRATSRRNQARMYARERELGSETLSFPML